jgi:hypothetical protein
MGRTSLRITQLPATGPGQVSGAARGRSHHDAGAGVTPANRSRDVEVQISPRRSAATDS